MELYVGNLCYNMTETDLGGLFRLHGSVVKVNISRDYLTRQSKCFGYVQMSDRKEGSSAMLALHGTRLNARLLVVKEARSRDERRGQPW